MTIKTTPERSNSFTIKTPTVIPAAYVNSTIATPPMKMNFRRSGSEKSINGNYETASVSSSYRKSTEFDHSEIDRLIKEEKYEELFTNVNINILLNQ